MKNIFVFLLCIVSAFAVSAQSTSPRFGTLKNQDNTGRVLTYSYTALTDVAGADSAIVTNTVYNAYYKITLLDSFTLKQPVVTKCFLGDRLTLIATAASGTPKLKFTGSDWISAGTATLSTGLRAVIEFVFDGAKWVETNRVVQ